MQVYKFGGTCTASPEKLERIVELVKLEKDSPLILTLSAASGITNQLNELLSSKLDEDLIKNHLERIKKRHLDLLGDKLDLPEEINSLLERLERLIYGIYYTEELTKRTSDLILSFGERLITPIMKCYLDAAGYKTTVAYPENFLITNGQHENSLVLLDETEQKISNEFNTIKSEFDVILVPGFYGVDSENVVNLLGRSGTDYTATVLAYGLDANSVTIWKDVYGFMSADPSLVPNAHTIPYLSYQEAAELAYFGAKLLHPRAASPARLKHIPIYIRHIDHLDSITCINSDLSHSDDVIKSVSHMTGLAILKVYAAVGGNTKGVLAAISDKIKEAGGNTISVATSQTCIAFLLNELEAENCVNPIQSLGKSIVDNIEIKNNISLICVVGEGLGSTPGVASKVFDAISSINVNVEMISAGASSTAYHFTVEDKDLSASLDVIHKIFFE